MRKSIFGRPFVGLLASFALYITTIYFTESICCAQTTSNISTNAQQPDSSYHRTWQAGAFAAGGFPPSYEIHGILRYQETERYYSAGLEAGRMLTAIHGPSFLRGQGEAIVELLPYWQVHHPEQKDKVYYSPGNFYFIGGFGEFDVHGVSVTPFLFRWNFMKESSNKFVPWIQLGSGLLWTSISFPQGSGQPEGTTSRINFTPQLDFGESIFVRKRQSLNLGVRAVHISSAGLGNYNPGVNVVVEFTAGYSWWK